MTDEGRVLDVAWLDAACGGVTVQDCHFSRLLNEPMALGSDDWLYRGPQGAPCPPNGVEMPSDFERSQPNLRYELQDGQPTPPTETPSASPGAEQNVGSDYGPSDEGLSDAGPSDYGAIE